MKKIITVSGSPRKNANTEKIMAKLIEGSSSVKVDNIRLDELTMSGCKSCFGCRKDQKCILNDDMKDLYNKINEADLVVLGSPIYMWQMTAQTKLFTDRLYPFLKDDYTSTFGKKGKDLVLIYTQGEGDVKAFDDYIQSCKRMYGVLGFNVIKTIIGAGTLEKEDILQQKSLLDDAFNFGKELM